ncbi:MAG TPA: arsinothricin resistance N-acetyltransferase ArsN1 family A [Methylomirabilota bacterium]
MTAPLLRIRPATVADAASICRIYNQGIQDRVATLETEERTPDERAEWLQARGPRHPVLVAEHEGAVAGWASLNVFNARRAYEHVADVSLYVERGSRGRGVGRQLLDALVLTARELGYHKLVLAAFPWNEAGMRAYRRAGFREVGIYKEQGRLDGRWVDTVVMEKILAGPSAH